MKANFLTPECAAERLKKSIVFNLKRSNQLFISIDLIQLSVDLRVHTKTKRCYKSCYAKIKSDFSVA